MPRLAELFVAARTRNVEGAGTPDPPLLLASRGTADLFQVPLDTDKDGLRRGKSALFRINLEHRVVDSEDLLLRLIATGDNAWAPEHVISWGLTSRTDGERVIPLAAQIELATPLTDPSAGTWLSTDRREGVSTLALRPMRRPTSRTRAARMIVVVATSQYVGFDVSAPGPGGPFEATGTESQVTLQAGGPSGLLLDFPLPQTPQDDLGRGRANLHLMDVPGPFSRADLADGSFVLSIAGVDWWNPVYVSVFGLDTASGQPTTLIPFVHAPARMLRQMSSDPAEGWSSHRLPTAAVPLIVDTSVPIPPGELAGLLARDNSNEDPLPDASVPVIRVSATPERGL